MSFNAKYGLLFLMVGDYNFMTPANFKQFQTHCDQQSLQEVRPMLSRLRCRKHFETFLMYAISITL